MMPIHPMEKASIDIINDYWDELLKDQGELYRGPELEWEILYIGYYNWYYG